MRKINKIINIALMFILIGVLLWSDVSYALRAPLQFNEGNKNFIKSHLQKDASKDKNLSIPQDTIKALQNILVCSNDKSRKICEITLSYFTDKKKEFDSYYMKEALGEPWGSWSVIHVYPTKNRDFISIIGHNHSAVRFFYVNGQLLIMEVSPLNRGSIIYKDQEKLLSLAEHMSDKILRIIKPKGITNEDLNKLFWAVPKEEWFTANDGIVRPLHNDEMYIILKRVSDKLIEAGFYVDEERGSSRDFMDDIGSMNRHGGYGDRLQLEYRIQEHHIFFDALNLKDDEFVVFLARDAISAYEFLNYLDKFRGINLRSGLVYQPGLWAGGNYSNYKADDRLAHVMKITSKIFYETKKKLGIPNPKGYDGDPDERDFDKNLYRKFSKIFKKKVSTAIENDNIVKQEAEFIYRQLRNIETLGYKKIRIVDLHATGRTIYYVKSVLEYFAEKEGIKFDSVDGFVGYGRGEGVGLPKATHRLPTKRVYFTDVFWPFYMDSRNYNTGIVKFYAMHSRYMVLLHAYHSLRLFNESVTYFRAKQGLSLDPVQKKDSVLVARKPGKKKEFERHNIILELERSEFLKIYRKKGYFRPGFFGEDREAVFNKLDEWFGEGKWKLGHIIEGKFVFARKALKLYEDAYVEFFKTHPEELGWLVKNVKDVYDNSLSNIESGIDYDKQETPAHHYQDIAIRRALKRLKRKFEGKDYLQIRGPLSSGYSLNPGLVPFHSPDLILKPQLTGWWAPNSTEAFYQSNKVIILEGSISSLKDKLGSRVRQTGL